MEKILRNNLHFFCLHSEYLNVSNVNRKKVVPEDFVCGLHPKFLMLKSRLLPDTLFSLYAITEQCIGDT